MKRRDPGGIDSIGDAYLSASVGVADLKIENDVAGELRLRPAAIKTLEYIAQRGGEVSWTWEGIKQETREMVADLILAGILIEREYVTDARQLHGRLALKLTDKGRNVLETHGKRKIVASKVTQLG